MRAYLLEDLSKALGSLASCVMQMVCSGRLEPSNRELPCAEERHILVQFSNAGRKSQVGLLLKLQDLASRVLFLFVPNMSFCGISCPKPYLT